MEVYKAFSKELVASLNPETPMERQLAQTVADTQWRLNRARSFEDGMLALGESEGDSNLDSALSAAKVFRDKRSLPPVARTPGRTKSRRSGNEAARKSSHRKDFRSRWLRLFDWRNAGGDETGNHVQGRGRFVAAPV